MLLQPPCRAGKTNKANNPKPSVPLKMDLAIYAVCESTQP